MITTSENMKLSCFLLFVLLIISGCIQQSTTQSDTTTKASQRTALDVEAPQEPEIAKENTTTQNLPKVTLPGIDNKTMPAPQDNLEKEQSPTQEIATESANPSKTSTQTETELPATEYIAPPKPVPAIETQETCIKIIKFHFDAAGNDHQNLNDEYITFKNGCVKGLNLTGWTIRDKANHEYTFTAFLVPSGTEFTLHTGSGADTANERYWGNGQAIWNNDGDTLYMRNQKGELVLEHTYS